MLYFSSALFKDESPPFDYISARPGEEFCVELFLHDESSSGELFPVHS